jgi:hypothetical protein
VPIMGRVAPAARPKHRRVMLPTMVEVEQRDYQVIMGEVAAGRPAQVAQDVRRLLLPGQPRLLAVGREAMAAAVLTEVPQLQALAAAAVAAGRIILS